MVEEVHAGLLFIFQGISPPGKSPPGSGCFGLGYRFDLSLRLVLAEIKPCTSLTRKAGLAAPTPSRVPFGCARGTRQSSSASLRADWEIPLRVLRPCLKRLSSEYRPRLRAQARSARKPREPATFSLTSANRGLKRSSRYTRPRSKRARRPEMSAWMRTRGPSTFPGGRWAIHVSRGPESRWPFRDSWLSPFTCAELQDGFTLKPCRWLNSGRESGSIPARDQHPPGSMARVSQPQVTAIGRR